MEKKVFAGNMTYGTRFDDVFYLNKKYLKSSKTGSRYLDLYLGDKTGMVNAKVWDWQGKDSGDFSAGDFVRVRGIVENFNDELQVKVQSIEKLSSAGIEPSDFVDSVDEKSLDNYMDNIYKTIEKVRNPHIKDLMESFFLDSEFVEKYRRCPAARNIHHDLAGGLAKHTSYMLAMGQVLAKLYHRTINRDLLAAGILFHDIGKVRELQIEYSISYTTEGELIGHAVLGIEMIREKTALIPDFPRELGILLEHMLLSHHGLIQYGAAKIPRFPEAMLLHLIDSIDSKMEIFDKYMKKVPEGELWSEKCWAVENQKLFSIENYYPLTGAEEKEE